MNSKNQTLLNCMISAAVSVIFLYMCSVSFLKPVIENVFGITNIPAYALSILFFIVFFLFAEKIHITYDSFPVKLILPVLSVFLLLSLIFEKRDIYFPAVEFTVPTPFLISITAVSFICFCCVLSNKKCCTAISGRYAVVPQKTKNTVVIILSGLLIGISAYNQYNLDFFTYFDYYHLHAYFNSISNFFWGQPYTETITSIYGHYGFFYFPILKIAYHLGFRNIYKAYMLTSSTLIIISLLIWIRILSWNIRNRFVLLLGIFGVCYINAARLVYLTHQLYPHRAFPIAVTALMIALWYRTANTHRKMISILGYLVSMLLIIWSTEFGIFALVSWAALHICSALQTKDSKNLQKVLLHTVAIPFFFLAAVELCGGINVIFGGEMISVREFLFPLFEKDQMVESHEMTLKPYPSAWMSIIFFLFCFLGYGIKDTFLYGNTNKRCDQSSACFAIAVLALGTMTYPINRPTYIDFYLIMPIAALFMAIPADLFFKDMPHVFRKDTRDNKNVILQGSIAILSVFVLTYLMISAIINIPYKIKTYEPYKNTKKIDDAISWMANLENNQNALSMGNITNFLYAWLGRDTGFYHMDSSDFFISPKFQSEIIEKAKYLEGQSVFVSNDLNYDLPKEFTDTHWEFSMYKNDDTSIYFWIPKN